MDDETEVIKKQMADTRESLAEKVEALENKVLNTVQGATDTVASTVESVSDTVAAVKQTVEGTVESVKDGVRDAADSVKGALDIGHHARERPWTVFAGSIAVGLLGGFLLTPRRRDPRDRRWPNMSGGPSYLPTPWSGVSNGNGLPPPQAGTHPLEQPKHEEGPGWFDKVTERLEPALDQLKELAIGATVSVVGKMLMDNAPPAFRGDLSGVIDQFATALGGKPMSQESAQTERRDEPQPDEQQKPHNRLSGAKGRGNGRSLT